MIKIFHKKFLKNGTVEKKKKRVPLKNVGPGLGPYLAQGLANFSVK